MAFDAKRSCLAVLSVAAAAFVVCPAVFSTAGSVGNMIADASGKDSEDCSCRVGGIGTCQSGSDR